MNPGWEFRLAQVAQQMRAIKHEWKLRRLSLLMKGNKMRKGRLRKGRGSWKRAWMRRTKPWKGSIVSLDLVEICK
jgi:hypothetical protein